jgi:transposase
MLRITFSQTEIAELHYERFHHLDPRVQRRMEVVYLKALGYAHQEIGRLVRVSQKTVRRCLCLYRDGGLAALKANHAYQPTSALQAHQDSIEAEFQAHPLKTLKEAQARVQTLTGIRRSRTQVRTFLRRLGCKRLKVAPIPAKADVVEQPAFLETQLKPRLAELRNCDQFIIRSKR